MSTQPSQKSTTNGAQAIKIEDQQQATLNQQLQNIDWNSERQLMSSLAKLQELESKIHELRTLLPDRLLAPIIPIVHPRRPPPASATSNSLLTTNSIPRSPQALSAALRKSAVEGVTELNEFKQLWTSADMQDIWRRVDERLAETKGAFPQMEAGMWRVDYAAVLKEMEDDENKKDVDMQGSAMNDDSHREKAEEEVEEEEEEEGWQFPAAIYGTKAETDPKTILASFQARQVPGLRLATSRNESSIIVSLGLAGLTFEIQEALTTGSKTSSETSTTVTKPEWRVSTRQHHKATATATGISTSRLESAIAAQLNSRPRKRDLRFLLELIMSYADIRSLPCKKCGQLTDSTAQLPVLRRAVATPSEGGSATAGTQGIVWEGYHVGCIKTR